MGVLRLFITFSTNCGSCSSVILKSKFLFFHQYSTTVQSHQLSLAIHQPYGVVNLPGLTAIDDAVVIVMCSFCRVHL